MFSKLTAPEEMEGQARDYGESLGSYLKEARVAKGLELSAIAEETSININSLVALEEDDRAGLPADVFARGYVRIYAAHLKLDPDDAVRRFERQWGTDTSFRPLPVLADKPSSLIFNWPTLLIVLLVAFIFGVRFFYSGHHGESGEQNGFDTLTPQHSPTAGRYGITPAPPAQTPVQNQTPSPTAGQTGNGKSATQSPQPTMVVGQSGTGTADTVGHGQTTPPVATPPYEITLHCREQTTVTISLDDQKAVEQIVAPESSQTWQAAKGFTLTIARTAGGVELTINGVPVPIKEAAGQPVTIKLP